MYNTVYDRASIFKEF